MMVIDNNYGIGDTVYLKTDIDQLPRIIYAIKVTQRDIVYLATSGVNVSEHYDFELSSEKDTVLQTS